MKLHDTHAHLLFPALADRLEQVLDNARRAGVLRITVPALGPDLAELARALDFAARTPGITVIAGVHPHHASTSTQEFLDAVSASADRLVAWGEIGLDFHYDFSPRDVQAAVFADQLDRARTAGLPVALHVREAHDETLALLREHPAQQDSIVHCFTGDAKTAEKYLDLGFFISFSGIVTFPKALEVQEAARLVPADRLLVETDAPYLAPRTHRGHTCEPAYVLDTLLSLAALRGDEPAALAAAAWENGHRALAARGGGLELT
ncbi:TatD family hydrolase [Myxococcota bacterium]|nr:TatD family hydrolase [Myxococcota bacterium]MBU1412202.1 TatD family hydrolase [Myxococcota bacterium]MBU1511338.1 TatD family hydrolase [Myxococcota bacterium]